MGSALRDSDMVSRLGGDEFVIVLNDVPNQEHLEHVIDKMLNVLSETHRINDNIVSVSGSIGAITFPRINANANELIAIADRAMYDAKKLGRNTFYITQRKQNLAAVA